MMVRDLADELRASLRAAFAENERLKRRVADLEPAAGTGQAIAVACDGGGAAAWRDIGSAVRAVKSGSRARRAGDEAGAFLFLVSGTGPGAWRYTDGRQDNYTNAPFIAKKTADGRVVPWSASPDDMLAEDWLVLP